MSVYKPKGSKVYYSRIKVGGRWTNRSTHKTNRPDAVQVEADWITNGVDRPGGCQVTFGAFKADYLTWAAGRRAGSSVKQRATQINGPLSFFDRYYLDEITPEVVDRFIAERQAQTWRGRPLHGRAINANLSTLSVVLGLAMERRLIHGKPWLRRPKLSERDSLPRDAMTFEEVRDLLAACRKSRNPQLYLFVCCLVYCGQRPGATARLTWEDVDWRQSRVWFRRRNDKRERDRWVPLVESLRKVLEAAAGAAGGNPTGRIFRQDQFKDSWETALRVEAKITRPEVTQYSCRHTWATNLIASGVDVVTVAEMMGNSPAIVMKTYAHAVESAKRSAGRKIPDYETAAADDQAKAAAVAGVGTALPDYSEARPGVVVLDTRRTGRDGDGHSS